MGQGVLRGNRVSADPDIALASRDGYSAAMTHPPLTLWHWRRVEYDPLVELGVFEGEPIELIGGQLVVGEPQSAYHASAIRAVDYTESSVVSDRIHKGSLYARAGIQDYWIVNLVDRALEIYGDPGPAPSAPYGWRYRSVMRLVPPALVSPLALPASRVFVADLLP